MARKFTDGAAFDGESLTGTFAVPDGTTAVVVKLADGSKTAEVNATENDDGTWSATASATVLSGFYGQTRWVVYATTDDGTEVVADGAIYIRPLVSKYRAVVAAVELALETYGTNPNRSISVGELQITYKDRAELLDILSYYRSRLAADEAGTTPKGGIKFMKVRFGRV